MLNLIKVMPELKILIVEDSEDDTLLLVNKIKKSKPNVQCKQVQTAMDFKEAVLKEDWDIVLSDYYMPGFNGLEALSILQELKEDIPFIIISGTIGEDQAVHAMKLGAHDYLMKNNLERLVPAIERELKDARTRAENKLLRIKQEETEAIRLSEEKFKKLISDMHVGVLLFDFEGKLQLSNTEVLELLDLREEHLSGKCSIPADWSAGFEDGSIISEFPAYLNQISLMGSSTRNMMIEIFRPTKNDHVWLMVDAVPQYSEEGNLLHVIWTFVDKTERKKAINALMESEERYRGLVEMSPEAIAIHQDNKIVFINESGIKQIGAKTGSEIIGKSIFKVVHPDFIKRLIKNIALVKKGQATPFMEEKFVRMDGTTIDVDVSAIPSKYMGRDATQVIIRDISERKRAEEEIKSKNQELETVNQQKDNFFSILAHDLRSPISSLIGITEVLAENIQRIPVEKLQEVFYEIKDSARNLYQLLENLLQWANLQQGLVPLKIEKIGLLNSVNQAIKVHTDLARIKDIKIECNIPENMSVFFDINMLQFVVRNLVSNAIKFTHRRGVVTIEARYANNKDVEIEIRDTGIGMDKKTLDDLFKLNASVNRRGTQDEPSSGLGLILCKEYIETNGGQIRVESKIDVGSSFFIVIKGEET